tara:strand:- start:4792 stop:5367 length:576 start_codon:yes stop_codon:yes gene_type:complete
MPYRTQCKECGGELRAISYTVTSTSIPLAKDGFSPTDAKHYDTYNTDYVNTECSECGEMFGLEEERDENKERAARAQLTIGSYKRLSLRDDRPCPHCEKTGYRVNSEGDHDDCDRCQGAGFLDAMSDGEVIADLFTDLMHWAASGPIDGEEHFSMEGAFRQAQEHFNAEQEEAMMAVKEVLRTVQNKGEGK